MKRRVRTAILISGRGSNMAALIAAARAPDFPAEIALVLSNRHDAAGLALAKRAGVATATIDPKIYAGRDEFEASIQAMLEIHRIEIVCLAGYMRILGAPFVNRWRGRMINIHPSLLPAYRGLQTHQRVLADGVAEHGCTVHFVEPELDVGPDHRAGARAGGAGRRRGNSGGAGAGGGASDLSASAGGSRRENRDRARKNVAALAERGGRRAPRLVSVSQPSLRGAKRRSNPGKRALQTSGEGSGVAWRPGRLEPPGGRRPASPIGRE